MSKKVAVVTGSNKGLGFAIVQELCQHNYGIVYLTSRDEARGKRAIKELENCGFKPEFRRLDVTDQVSVDSFVEHIKDKHGKIDLLVNNAGILYLKDATETLTYQAEQTLKVNFFSLVEFTEKMLPVLKNGARILNISSSSGHLSRIPSEALRKRLQEDMEVEELKVLIGSYLEKVKGGRTEEWGESPYVVSKVGVNAYTFLLHRRLGDRDISVNSFHPGYVISDMTRGGGSVSPARGARGALASALGGARGRFVWHTGAPVPWDGEDPRGYIDGRTSN